MKIGFLEIVLILISLLWVLGIFRKISEPSPTPQKKTPARPPAGDAMSKPVKKPLYGEDGEFVEYEELKE